MTWAAILAIGGRIDEDGAKRKLELAVKDEVAFWNRLEQRGGDVKMRLPSFAFSARYNGDRRRLAF
jgi:hypothetical protein